MSAAWNESRALVALRDATLADFTGLERIGESHSREGTYYGCNSIVCGGSFRGARFALKALLTGGADQTDALVGKFESELNLADASRSRLSASPHVVRAVRSFVSDVSALPGWEKLQELFGGQLAPRTLVLVMPFMPLNLKSVVSDARRGAHAPITERIFLAYFAQLLRGAKHLHDAGVCHRDLKLDNVLLTGEADPHARRVAIADLGEAIDCLDPETGEVDWLMSWVPGTKKGGAPIAIAPEVHAVKPSRRAVVDYARNDAWALGRIVNDVLRSTAPHAEEVSGGVTDASFRPLRPERGGAFVRELHAGLLRVDPAERLTIDGALARVERELARCADGECVPTPSAPPLGASASHFMPTSGGGAIVVALQHLTSGGRLDCAAGAYVGDLRVRAALAFAQPLERTRLVLAGALLDDDGATLDAVGALDGTLVTVLDKPPRALLSAHAEISRLTEECAALRRRTERAEHACEALSGGGAALSADRAALSRGGARRAPAPGTLAPGATRLRASASSRGGAAQTPAAVCAASVPADRRASATGDVASLIGLRDTLVRVKLGPMKWKRGFVLTVEECEDVTHGFVTFVAQIYFGSTGVLGVTIRGGVRGAARPYVAVTEERVACFRKVRFRKLGEKNKILLFAHYSFVCSLFFCLLSTSRAFASCSARWTRSTCTTEMRSRSACTARWRRSRKR